MTTETNAPPRNGGSVRRHVARKDGLKIATSGIARKAAVAALRAQAEAMLALADAIEAEEQIAPSQPAFIDRSPPWLERCTFRRALAELAREGRVFTAGGRRRLVRPHDLEAWVEAHPVRRLDERQELASEDAGFDYEHFMNRAAEKARGRAARQ